MQQTDERVKGQRSCHIVKELNRASPDIFILVRTHPDKASGDIIILQFSQGIGGNLPDPPVGILDRLYEGRSYFRVL